MAQYRYFHIDAFANAPLMGNQAAVIPMDAFLPDVQLQAIATENNFAETAYIVQTSEDSYDLRWFTPAIEVPLCGHATLASAHVLFNHLGFAKEAVHFDTRKSGRLSVRQLTDGRLEMDFPAQMPKRVEAPAGLADALGCNPIEVWSGPFVMVVLENAETVRRLRPDIAALSEVTTDFEGDRGNIICSAPGDNGYDVVSRFFGPGSGIDEDPATGSAHCIIGPLFVEKLGKPEISCFQAYPGRGAHIDVRLEGGRIKLIGRSFTVVEGTFFL